MSLLWINGELVDKSVARISPFDHGFLYGDGVWEHFRAFGGKLFLPEEHAKCLFKSASEVGIEIPISHTELFVAIEATVRANDRTEGYVRVIVSRGQGTLGPDPRKLDPQIIIIAEEYHPFPLELYESGLDVRTYPLRFHESHVIWHARSLSQFHIVEAKIDAVKKGCFETVFLTDSWEAAGCTEGDLFTVQSGIITCAWMMRDVHSEAIIGIAQKINLRQGFCAIELDGLIAADEVFIAGTSCGVIAIVRVDGTAIAAGKEGPITKRIREAYRKLTRGEA